MQEQLFNLSEFNDLDLSRLHSHKECEFYRSRWQSPSNIAFVKYWGKKGPQLPANPSLSMSLENCSTTTELIAQKTTLRKDKEGHFVQVFLDGSTEDNRAFAVKIENYLYSLSEYFPWLKDESLQFIVHTQNTFPHGTGIASSASGLSAFALCLTELIFMASGRVNVKTIGEVHKDPSFIKVASQLARLASGSACRSVYGGMSAWGAIDLNPREEEAFGNLGLNDLFAVPFNVHENVKNLCDAVVIVSHQEKSVSSRAGHQKMSEHFFAEARYKQAQANFIKMMKALKEGHIEVMGEVLESEAMSLHAMMLTTTPCYTLLMPNTLKIIQSLWAFRQETHVPVYFTLDAGPNVHLIYRPSDEVIVRKFIDQKITSISEKIIFDYSGQGPRRC